MMDWNGVCQQMQGLSVFEQTLVYFKNAVFAYVLMALVILLVLVLVGWKIRAKWAFVGIVLMVFSALLVALFVHFISLIYLGGG